MSGPGPLFSGISGCCPGSRSGVNALTQAPRGPSSLVCPSKESGGLEGSPPRPPARVVFSPPQGTAGFLEAQEALWTGEPCWRPQAAPCPGLSRRTTPIRTTFSRGSAGAGGGTPVSCVAASVHPWERRIAEWVQGEQVGVLSPVITEEQRAGI